MHVLQSSKTAQMWNFQNMSRNAQLLDQVIKWQFDLFRYSMSVKDYKIIHTVLSLLLVQ